MEKNDRLGTMHTIVDQFSTRRMHNIFGVRERPNWCSAVTMQHHESFTVDSLHERVGSVHERVDSLHERIDRLQERVDRLHEGGISLHEHATTGRAAKEGLWQRLDPAVRVLM